MEYLEDESRLNHIGEVNLTGQQRACTSAVCFEIHHAAVVVGRCHAEIVGSYQFPYIITAYNLIGENRLYLAIGERFAPRSGVGDAYRCLCRRLNLGSAAFGDSLNESLHEALAVEILESVECVEFNACAFYTRSHCIFLSGEVFIYIICDITFAEGASVDI